MMIKLSVLFVSLGLAFPSFGLDSTAPKGNDSEQKSENPAVALPVPKIIDSDDSDDVLDKPGVISFSSAVNVIRKMGRTEVVFRNGESLFIPSGSKFNDIYSACEESAQTGKEISVVANGRTRTIIQAGGAGGGKAKNPQQR